VRLSLVWYHYHECNKATAGVIDYIQLVIIWWCADGWPNFVCGFSSGVVQSSFLANGSLFPLQVPTPSFDLFSQKWQLWWVDYCVFWSWSLS
jgi:hypothetical protein